MESEVKRQQIEVCLDVLVVELEAEPNMHDLTTMRRVLDYYQGFGIAFPAYEDSYKRLKGKF